MLFRFLRRRRRSRYGRKPQKRFLPLVIGVGIIFFILWGGGKLISGLFSDGRSESIVAEVEILDGKAEFSLAENENWTAAYSGQKFFTEDSIRTGSKSQAVLEITGGNTIFLDENSEVEFVELEQKSANKKNILLKLNKGKLWAKVSDDDFNNDSKSRFEIETPRFVLHVRGTVFAVSSGSSQDTVRLVRGNVDVDVKENDNIVKNLKVGVGQKLIVSNETLKKIKSSMDVLEIIDSEFIESEWHIQNLAKFYPQEAAQIRRRIELSAAGEEKKKEETEKKEGEIDAPEILEPADAARISGNVDTVKIEGTAPPEAAQIVVNGFTLTKFQPGDRKWTYFAAKKFGTLLPGENTFSVYAVSRDGKKSNETKVVIFYEGADAAAPTESTPAPITPPAPTPTAPPATPQPTSSPDFKAPAVTKPAILGSGEIYETSADVVTISGTVDPKTNMVKVNGYQLKKFKAGDTEFTYIASARYGVRSNLKEGENNYEIMAFGPDGKISSTVVKVIYTPVKIN